MSGQKRLMRGVMATTGIDRQNDVYFPDTIYQIAESVNSDVAMRMGVDHNRTVPPTGKILKAYVEPRDGGGIQVVGEIERFAPPMEIELPDGTVGFFQESATDLRPFMAAHQSANDNFIIVTDQFNFESPEEWEAFYSEVREQSGDDVVPRLLTRKAFLPQPEMVIALAKPFAAAFAATALGKKLIEALSAKLGTTLAEDIDKLYRVVRSAVWAGAKRILPKNRPVTYVLEAAGEPSITFVAVTTKPEVFIKATEIETLAKALEGITNYHERFDAVEIQYLLDEQGEWKFNYLLTTKGQAIGTKKAYSHRARVIQNLLEQRQENSGEPLEELEGKTEDEMLDQLYTPGQPMSVGGVASGRTNLSGQPKSQQAQILNNAVME